MVMEMKRLSNDYVITEIGEIPKDWKVESLGNMCNGPLSYGLNESAIEFNENLPRYLRITDITTDGKLHKNGMKSVNVKSDDYLLSEGDIVVARTGATVGKSYLYNEKDGSCAYAGYLIRIRLNKKVLIPNFLIQVMHSQMYYKWIKKTLKEGAQPNINSKEYASFKLAVPSLLEQLKITEILAAADGQIEKTEQLIEKTKELKKGLTKQLLTKGIGNNEFKDTLLGEIPDSWEVRMLAEIGTFQKGKGIAKKDLAEKGNLCILYGELYTKYKETINTVYSRTEFQRKDAVIANYNDVLIPSSGETAYDIACASALLVNDVLIGGDTNIFTPKEEVLGAFISYSINSYLKHRLAKLAQGSSVYHLYASELKKFYVAIPSLKEQQAIVDIISTIDNQIEIYEKEKYKQIELKEALLQQLLTGKIRVTV